MMMRKRRKGVGGMTTADSDDQWLCLHVYWERKERNIRLCVCVPYWVVWCAVAAAAAEFDCISAHDAIAVTCLPHCFQTICYILRERERVCSNEWISLIKMLTNTWRSIIGPRLVSASTAGALLLPPASCCRGVRNHTFEYHSKVEENTFFLMYLH